MEFLKNNLIVAALIIGTLLAAITWIYWPKPDISKEQVTTWITEGYSQQFCKAVYPKISDCITLSRDDCKTVTAEQIGACVEMSAKNFPSSTTSAAAKELYDSLATCFQTNIHQKILDEYLVDTPECQERMQ